MDHRAGIHKGRADFGLAYDAGTNKLYALGGDLPVVVSLTRPTR